MIIEMPFIQRYVGRTKNLSEVRQLAAWDQERVKLAEHGLSEFEIGSHFGDGVHTLYREGSHWAYYGTSVTGKLDHRTIDVFAVGRALTALTQSVDMTRFFPGGRVDIRVSGMPHSPPDPKWTEETERDLIVSRLIGWVGENIVTIDGNLAVRVGEPSLRVRISADDSAGMHGLIVQRDKLTPLHSIHAVGIHFSLDEVGEIQDALTTAVNDHSHLDGFKFIHDAEEMASMTLCAAATESMYERSLLSVVHDAVGQRLVGRYSKQLAETVGELKELLLLDEPERTDDVLERMADGLNRLRPNLEKSRLIIALATLDRWHDRPIGAMARSRSISEPT
jgi:hypothetical protein